MVAELAASGAWIDGIYFCHHKSEETCDCRKPKPGMLEQAAREHGLDLPASWVVGDRYGDLEMAHAAEELGLPHLALWFLEQGHEQVPKSVALLRAMAQHYETLNELNRAVELWQAVVELEPENDEAQRKINELSVREHLAGGHYRTKRKRSQ